jgi:DNA-directed RNA polymerase subunit RPC12/RpoP
MKSFCQKCGKPLHPDEEGLSIKLLGHNITEYYCIDCLGAKMGITPNRLREMIERYRDLGCQLFTPRE